MADKPILAMPLGDAAGVGPEIAVKALLDEELRTQFRPLLIGQRWVLEGAFALAGGSLPLRVIGSAEEANYTPGVIDLLEIGRLDPSEVHLGQVAEATGREGGATLAEAGRLVGSGKATGLVSAPINKAACGLGGYGHGHMEIVTRTIGWEGPIYSMLAGPRLKVVNVTGHCSVVEACRLIDAERILTTLQVTHDWFRRFGFERARLAVCALNPHGGDSGVFGREEIEHVAPAVAAAQDRGIDARGPFPVDTLFARALAGEFDAVVALYHDQGFTAVKTVGLHDTASLGLGLPIAYATTDHGTGFDLAGRGVANPGSYKQAIRTVLEMCAGGKC